MDCCNKKHLKNVGPIRHCKPPHAHSSGVASGTVTRRLRIDVHDIDNDNAWQRGPRWPHGMGPITTLSYVKHSNNACNSIEAFSVLTVKAADPQHWIYGHLSRHQPKLLTPLCYSPAGLDAVPRALTLLWNVGPSMHQYGCGIFFFSTTFCILINTRRAN